MTENLDIQSIIDNTTLVGVLALGIIFVAKPLVGVLVDYLKGKLTDSKIDKAYSDAVMKELGVIKSNHFSHLEANQIELIAIARSIKEATERIERKVENLN